MHFIIGALMMAGVYFVLWISKKLSKSSDLKLTSYKKRKLTEIKDAPETNSFYFKLFIISEALWLFIALYITSGLSDYSSGLALCIAFLCLSAPVIIFHIIDWLINISKWSGHIFLIGVICQLLAGFIIKEPIKFSYNDETFRLILLCMMAAFPLFYIIRYFPSLWNRYVIFINEKISNEQ